MSRKLTPKSSLENLKREAKRWLKALRDNDPDARARLEHVTPDAPAAPALRDVQNALAREYGFAGWTALKQELEARRAALPPATRAEAIQALLEAAGQGDAARVTRLLDVHPDLINERGELGGSGLRTALHFGVRHEPVVRALLQRGADPNIRDQGDAAMPLHFAAERGRLAVVRLLIEHGADPVGAETDHLLNVLGWATCFEYAYHAEVAEYLLAHGARHTIHTAVAMGATDEIRRLAARSQADLELPMDRTNHRRRPLHLAVIKRQPASLATLLELGADAEAEDEAGLTALDQAALGGDGELARQLLDGRAKLRLPAAVALERVDDVERLLKEDRECLRPGGRWGRLIIRAAERSSGRVIEALIRGGASVHVRDDHRRPAGPTTPGAARRANLILEGAIDIFDAILFRPARLPEIVGRDPGALDRKFGRYVTGDPKSKPWLDPAWTPLDFARAKERHDAVRTLTELKERSAEDRIADFLEWACLDWRHDGSERVGRMHDAGRLLARRPELAHANIYTAAVCGDLAGVGRLLAERPEAASAIGGPRSWPPLLYLCSARPPGRGWADNAVDIARLWLDYGADPNAFYLGGNADIHYTALTCVLGRGEEQAAMHPRARELAQLLLERGAYPHDGQVLYNVFADHASRHLLDEDIVWLLELMYQHSVRRGRKADWENPAWPMFEMHGAPSLGHEERRYPGARFMLDAAVGRNLLELAEWMLEHGADPNARAGGLWHGRPQHSLYEEAMARGFADVAGLLARYGAITTRPAREGYDAFVDASLAMDKGAVRAHLARHSEYLNEPRALFEAIRRDRADVVELLLDLGMSPDAEDASHGRKRALHEAAAAGAARSAELLIARGAAVDFRESRYNATPLGWASHFQLQPMIELFGGHSRDVWDLAYNGLVGRLREVLRQEPARARETSKQYGSPLFWLPSDSDKAMEVATLLLEHGADRAVRDAEGRTAADLAAKRGMDEVAALLRS